MSASAGRGREVAVVHVAAVVQGLALVTIPTLASVLTGHPGFGLSQTAYGTLFLPQTFFAIALSLAGGALTRRLGIKRVVLAGMVANAFAMGLLVASARVTGDRPLAYGALLVATAALGVGFALLTPALNVLAAAFAPAEVDRAVLVVNALLGAAAVLAPALLFVFVGLGVWWALPLFASIAMIALVVVSLGLPFDVASTHAKSAAGKIPARFWAFGAFALIYGFCEQMNGSWATIYIAHHLGGAASFGLLGLALFWAFAAGGRVVFAISGKRLPETTVFRALPFVLAAAFASLAFLPAHSGPLLGVIAYALAGLGVSALLPLVLSFSQKSMPEAATSVTSFVFAIYLVGYGLAAFGAGPLQHLGFALPVLYGASAVLALVAAGLAFAIVGILARDARAPSTAGARS